MGALGGRPDFLVEASAAVTPKLHACCAGGGVQGPGTSGQGQGPPAPIPSSSPAASFRDWTESRLGHGVPSGPVLGLRPSGWVSPVPTRKRGTTRAARGLWAPLPLSPPQAGPRVQQGPLLWPGRRLEEGSVWAGLQYRGGGARLPNPGITQLSSHCFQTHLDGVCLSGSGPSVCRCLLYHQWAPALFLSRCPPSPLLSSCFPFLPSPHSPAPILPVLPPLSSSHSPLPPSPETQFRFSERVEAGWPGALQMARQYQTGPQGHPWAIAVPSPALLRAWLDQLAHLTGSGAR